jgi:GT2 family glycosyltransferase
MRSAPDFSIIIPTCNRPKQLANLLLSLAGLDYPVDRFEIIVVDDGSTEPAQTVVSAFSSDLDMTLLKQENSGPAAARNHGASRAGGRFLAFTDDDCVVDDKWLQALEKAFLMAPLTICGGKTINLLSRNIYSTACQLLLDFLSQHYSPQEHPAGFYPTLNFSAPRVRFLEAGGFDPRLRFGEDRDFCFRWASLGYPFRFVPEAVVYHSHPLRISSFSLLHFYYGGGSYRFRRECVDRGRTPPKLSPPSFYIQLILSGIKKERNRYGALLSLLLLVSQIANTAGHFCEALKRGRGRNLRPRGCMTKTEPRNEAFRRRCEDLSESKAAVAFGDNPCGMGLHRPSLCSIGCHYSQGLTEKQALLPTGFLNLENHSGGKT